DNPIIPASGTFGFGHEFADYYDVNCLGSISLKGTTKEGQYGNDLPRIAECPVGMLNAIGLQNPGVHAVINEELPKLAKVYSKKVIANVGGHRKDEYVYTCAQFNGVEQVFAVELNVSCPNVSSGGMTFGIDIAVLSDLIKAVKKECTKPLIVKLSPNVTDIVSFARAAEDSGADGLTLINTLMGMRLDLKTGKPILANIRGGYSGAGIFPVAIRMVYDCANAVKIPIIGCGGVTCADNVREMLLAGAKAVQIGTENLINPYACRDIINALNNA
ncbi:MAG: dihydroorotate dehydrogenase, partial [Christensenellaceae bacterium]|nr:dihydroorotate dehydrogenase [Christensenellaceae bacterium]